MIKMPKQRLVLLIGIVGIVFTLIMLTVYVDQKNKEAMKKAQQASKQLLANSAPVLMARRDIPSGATITSDSVDVAIIPNQFIQPKAATTMDRIDGMRTVAPIAKGEQITLSKLVFLQQQQQRGGGLAEATPIGKRAITITVDNMASLAGMAKPGDYVDVIATLPIPMQGADGKVTAQTGIIPLFQNVLVLAVGQDLGAQAAPEGGRYQQKEVKKESSPLITLALAPQEASLIAFVQEQGKIRLVARSPADSQIQPFQPVGWDTLLQYVMPKEPVVQAEPKKEEPKDYVEIYRGLNKEKVILTK